MVIQVVVHQLRCDPWQSHVLVDNHGMIDGHILCDSHYKNVHLLNVHLFSSQIGSSEVVHCVAENMHNEIKDGSYHLMIMMATPPISPATWYCHPCQMVVKTIQDTLLADVELNTVSKNSKRKRNTHRFQQGQKGGGGVLSVGSPLTTGHIHKTLGGVIVVAQSHVRLNGNFKGDIMLGMWLAVERKVSCN